MTIEADLALPSSAPGFGTDRAVAPWLAIATIAAAVALRCLLPFNVDVSWWLIVSERMLDGHRLYTDILETNPPMAGSVYLLAVALARALRISPEVATNGLIFALIAASMALAWSVLRGSALRERLAGGMLAVWTTALLSILPMYDFGQREHLALIAVLPSLAVYVLRGGGERVPPAAVLIAGCSAGLTMMFKPYFAFGVGFGILAAAAQARDWRVLLAAENWIAAGLVVINAACIFVFFPDYFTLIYPLVRDVYLLLAVPFSAIFHTVAVGLWMACAVVVLALQRRERKLDVATFIALAASFGFLVSFFAQRKGWGYHAYPMVALALLAAGLAISAIDRAPERSAWPRVVSAIVTAAIFANACVWFNGSIDVRPLEEQVARLGPRPKLLVLSAAAVIGHPMVRTLHGTWVSRQEAFWVREVVRRAERDGTIDAQEAARLQGYVAQERAGLIDDFRREPPDIVLIDNQSSNWGDWARADPELSTLLAPYVHVQTIDGIEILRRG
jgi:hypothetical protein